jgi:hypothetical protein
MMKKTWPVTIAALTTLALTLLAGCNNFFHELIPPDENRIVSFRVANQMGGASIGDTGLTITVEAGTDLAALVPEIQVSPKATLLPLTLAYVAAAFPSADITQVAGGIYSANDLSAWVIDLIKANPNFTVPPLAEPMDFTGPVDFLVVSGRGSIRRYTARISLDSGTAQILRFGFSKYDNYELVSDGFALVDQNTQTIHATVKYPVEYSASFELIPSFELLGDRLDVEGTEVRSGVDPIPFTVDYSTQTKNLTVYRSGYSETNYTLTVTFIEDPDSIRSITDFRFTKADNPGIVATAVASIVNSGGLGTVRIQVLYQGTKPTDLKAQFVSPGTVTVGGTVQTSRVTENNFSGPVAYRVVSRNGLYTRLYTVETEFINIVDLAPKLLSFRFSADINGELAQTTVGEINDAAGLVLVDAKYTGASAPQSLVPEFSASGIVKVSGLTQTSGSSSQDFTRQVKYTVVAPDNPLIYRDYWVQTRFIRDTSADAAITAFSFHPNENPQLADEVPARIDQIAGTIYAYLLPGANITTVPLVPRFTSHGKVFVEGVMQTSGSGGGRLFDQPVVYEVESANGLNHKTYTVTVQELNTRIYVDKDASGHNSGASWADAFISLKAACEAAALFADDVPREIWIAEGTYRASETGDAAAYFPLTPNTSYIGGFAGTETAKSQRNPAANPVIISGDLGGGVRSQHLFYGLSGGELAFEDLSFTEAQAPAGGTTREQNGAAINAVATDGTVTITNCEFTGLSAYYKGGAVYIEGMGLDMSGSRFENCTAAACGDLCVTNANSNITISDISINKNTTVTTNTHSGIDVNLSTGGTVNISDAELYNAGIRSSTVGGITYLSEITVTNSPTVQNDNIWISGAVNISDVTVSGTLASDAVYITSGSSQPVAISGLDVRNITGRGVSITLGSGAGSLSIEDMTIDGAQASSNGGGLYISNSSSQDTTINGLTIGNTTATGSYSSGGGAYISTSGSLSIEGVEISDTEVSGNYSNSSGGGLYISNSSSQDTTITGLAISNTKVTSYRSSGGGAYISTGGRLSIGNTSITGTQSNSGDGGGIFPGGGGGIFIQNLSTQDTTITGLAISNTAATGSYSAGGGARISSGGSMWIVYPSLSGTQSEKGGGGLAISNSSSQPTTITGLSISNATAAGYIVGGGGLSASSSGNITINGNSEFNNCRSDGSFSGTDGALYVYSPGTITIQDTRFIDNHATGGTHSDIASIVAQFVVVTNCEFKDTFPHPYGSVDMRKALITVGSYFGTYQSASFTGCTFTNLNTNQTNLGFVICSRNIYLTVTNSTFVMDAAQILWPIWAESGFNLDNVSFYGSMPPFMEVDYAHLYRLRRNCKINGSTKSDLLWRMYIMTQYGATLTFYN